MFKESSIKSIKFLLVGGGNTLITYALYVALVYIGFHYNLALILEYIVGIMFGYLMNKYWTFAGNGTIRNSFLKYCVTYYISFVINLIILNAIVRSGISSPILGQLIALGFASGVSFLLLNVWVFKRYPSLKIANKK